MGNRIPYASMPRLIISFSLDSNRQSTKIELLPRSWIYQSHYLRLSAPMNVALFPHSQPGLTYHNDSN